MYICDYILNPARPNEYPSFMKNATTVCTEAEIERYSGIDLSKKKKRQEYLPAEN